MTEALPAEVRENGPARFRFAAAARWRTLPTSRPSLASDMAGYVTGQVIQVDGGMNM